MMHSLFHLQQSIQEFRQLPDATSSPGDVAFSASLTAVPVKRILSPEWRSGRTTETARHIYQKILQSKRKPQVEQRTGRTISATLPFKPATTKGCSSEVVPCCKAPTLLLRMEKWSVWGLVPFPTSSTYKAHGLAHPRRRSQIYSAHIIELKPLHPPGCSPCHPHRSFPSHRWAERECEEDYP